MDTFINDLKQLNQQQYEAVNCTEQNALILAPAGTGKTKVIALRTAYLLQQNVSPENILNLTFTNKAAKEMEQRIALYVPHVAKNLTIKTFHSFCYHIINQEKENTRFSFPCTIIDESDTKDMLERILIALNQHGKKIDSTAVDYSLIHFIENVKKHCLTFPLEDRTQYKLITEDYIKKQNIRDPLIRTHGLQILKMYQKRLITDNCLDFADLIIEATNLLEDPHILEKWQKQYHYIQVDEMQDTSIREYNVVKKLAQNNNLVFYGDFNQTIYEWRGSTPMKMIADFRKIFSPLQIELTTNYRSTQTLLDAANQYIRNSKLYPLDCISSSVTSGEKIELLSAADEIHEFKTVASSIKKIFSQVKKVLQF